MCVMLKTTTKYKTHLLIIIFEKKVLVYNVLPLVTDKAVHGPV